MVRQSGTSEHISTHARPEFSQLSLVIGSLYQLDLPPSKADRAETYVYSTLGHIVSTDFASEIPEELSASADAADDDSGRSSDFAELLGRSVDATLDRSTAAPEYGDQLLHVARRHAGQPLSEDPILKELVGVVASRFSLLDLTQQEELTKAVAQTLFDDSASRMNLEKLWHRLQNGI
jgi:hypothetical protein